VKYPRILNVFQAAAALFSLPALALAMPVGNPAAPEPAKAVDLERCMGRWYELARYANRFEKDCEGVTATYSWRDGGVHVVNTCQ
jgi:apolipoprotein D and lipocalin family protein